MRFFQQEGLNMRETNLHESGRLCDHCLGEDHHLVYQLLADDAECRECHSLCSCACHRETVRDPIIP